MGQQEVYEFLKHNKNEWFCCKEIQEKMKITNSSASISLKKLRQLNCISFKLVPDVKNHGRLKYCYRYLNKEKI